MSEPTFDVAAAHRWFAVECNNEAWDLIEQESISEAERDRLLNLAHTSHLHWSRVGDQIHALRSAYLLATAYLKARRSLEAGRYAMRAYDAVQTIGESSVKPFDRACVIGATVAAARLRGDRMVLPKLEKLFDDVVRSVEDEEERGLVEALYGPEGIVPPLPDREPVAEGSGKS